MKTYYFLDGSTIDVDDNTCRGCFLEDAHTLPIELTPIIANSSFVIRQDAECPIPAFYILSAKAHICTFGDLNDNMASEIGILLRCVRAQMRLSLGIERVHIFLEERLVAPHLHIWLLPLWPQVMKENAIDPRIWNSNIKAYLDLFAYEDTRESILRCNKEMRDALLMNDDLRMLNYT